MKWQDDNRRDEPVLGILLHLWLVNLATDETLGVKDGVFRIGGIGVLCRVSDPRRG